MLLCRILGIQPPPDLAVFFQANYNNDNSITLNGTRVVPAATTIAAILTPQDDDDDEEELHINEDLSLEETRQ